MNEQLPDKRLEQLSKLIGDVLAKRWMQILNNRQSSAKRHGPRSSKVHRKHNKS